MFKIKIVECFLFYDMFLLFGTFEFLSFDIVSDFVIRISDFSRKIFPFAKCFYSVYS